MTKITRLTLALLLMFGIINVSAVEIINNSNGQSSQSSTIQRVRLDIVTPMGYTRHLLLGFTSDNIATDGFDYGYDGRNIDDFPDDCNWMIDGDRYVIQGVGAFDQTKKYPLGLFLTNSGNVEMSLNSLENFDSKINVFIYDSVLDNYSKITETNFTQNMSSGEYTDRYYIAFQDDNELEKSASLSIEKNNVKNTVVKYLRNNKEIYLKTNNETIKQITVYNILGKELFSIKNLNKSEIRIPVDNMNTNYGIVSVTTEKGIISKKIVLK